MTGNPAIFIGHQRDDAVAGFPALFYKFRLHRAAEGGQNRLVNSLLSSPMRIITRF